MSEYSEFFLNSGSNVAELECIEIIDPDFSQVYRKVRNAVNGVTVTHEDGSVHEYEYYPLQIKPIGSGNDLDQVLEVQLGDLGNIIPKELDAKRAADSLRTKPILKYRTYRSDDLSAPLYGPITLEISSLPSTKEGWALRAEAPRLNMTATGELYTTTDFPTLRGFI
jgi:hypothetical protein